MKFDWQTNYSRKDNVNLRFCLILLKIQFRLKAPVDTSDKLS